MSFRIKHFDLHKKNEFSPKVSAQLQNPEAALLRMCGFHQNGLSIALGGVALHQIRGEALPLAKADAQAPGHANVSPSNLVPCRTAGIIRELNRRSVPPLISS
jgi:hypothetical protein